VSNRPIDRTTLPIRRPPFQGVTNDTLDGSQPDWAHVAPISAPDGTRAGELKAGLEAAQAGMAG
jgi:hypothetical protein